MKRPTRVPASTVVRMNNASNMIAKWYQKARRPSPPITWEKIWDSPTASVGAPPVRPARVFSSTAAAAAARSCGEMVKPIAPTACDADSTVVPSTVPGMFIAKYRPGSSTHAAASAMIATNDSVSMAP